MSGKKYNLENNPLFISTPEENILEPSNRRGRPRNDNLVRDGVQAGLTEDSTRATFIIKVELLEEIKNYAYTERLKLKDAFERLLKESLENYKRNGGQLLDRNNTYK